MKNLIYLIVGAALLMNIAVGAEEKKDDGAEMIVNGNTEFTFDLYAQLKQEEGNTVQYLYSTGYDLRRRKGANS